MQTDILGEPYEQQTIDLGEDEEGPVSATLIRRRAETPSRRAVLYVHGFVDYFFQTHLADFYCARGYDFYAIDLRKYGRSLAPHQTANYCHDLADYYPELDEAARLIREVDGHDTLLVNGHSTGGLIVSLWAADRPGSGMIDALFLNSPFLDLNAPWPLRRLGAPSISAIGRRRPHLKIPFGLNTVYGETLHHEHRGEWEYDLAWKPLAGFPVRAGWLRAIRAGQQRVHRGLDLRVPVLVACSTLSYKRSKWAEEAASADAVLDVEHMVRWAPQLGRQVTLTRIDSGMHDLTLSGTEARAALFDALDVWSRAYLR